MSEDELACRCAQLRRDLAQRETSLLQEIARLRLRIAAGSGLGPLLPDAAVTVVRFAEWDRRERERTVKEALAGAPQQEGGT